MSAKKMGATWSLKGYFPRFNGPDMLIFVNKLSADITYVLERAAGLGVLSEETADEWETLVLIGEDCAARLRHLASFVICLEAVHNDAGEYQARIKNIGRLCLFSEFEVDLRRAFTGESEKFFREFLRREALAPIAYYLRRIRVQAGFSMSPAEEKLADELDACRSNNWAALYKKIADKLMFEMAWPDGRKEKMSLGRGYFFMADADRKVKEAAYEGVSRAWASIEDICAAALNAIAGTRLTLNKRRGVADFLDVPLFGAGISRQTINAMSIAVHDNLGTAREILLANARSMGRKGLCHYERSSHVKMTGDVPFTWAEATDKVSVSFDSAYPALGRYFRQFLKNRWLESAGRGKHTGAFCTSSTVSKEERVFFSFRGRLRDLNTIAHEIGHAWHDHLRHEIRFRAYEAPVTLNETAAIFAERILADQFIADKNISDEKKLILLCDDLGWAANFILDVTTRFEFEKAFYEERMTGEVSVERLKALMTGAQRRIYGDALEPGGEDPLLWASTCNYYGTIVPFFNFPYTFGFLFASALFSRFKVEGEVFLPKYETFLRLAGTDTVENLAREHFGFDLGDPSFWSAPFKDLEASVALYKKLLESVAGTGVNP